MDPMIMDLMSLVSFDKNAPLRLASEAALLSQAMVSSIQRHPSLLDVNKDQKGTDI